MMDNSEARIAALEAKVSKLETQLIQADAAWSLRQQGFYNECYPAIAFAEALKATVEAANDDKHKLDHALQDALSLALVQGAYAKKEATQ